MPIEAGLWANIFYRLRKLWRELRCKHTHTFTAGIDKATWFSSGKLMGSHTQLRLRGCYLCGQLRVEDFGA